MITLGCHEFILWQGDIWSFGHLNGKVEKVYFSLAIVLFDIIMLSN